jgi:hypothetical protein
MQHFKHATFQQNISILIHQFGSGFFMKGTVKQLQCMLPMTCQVLLAAAPTAALQPHQIHPRLLQVWVGLMEIEAAAQQLTQLTLLQMQMQPAIAAAAQMPTQQGSQLQCMLPKMGSALIAALSTAAARTLQIHHGCCRCEWS